MYISWRQITKPNQGKLQVKSSNSPTQQNWNMSFFIKPRLAQAMRFSKKAGKISRVSHDFFCHFSSYRAAYARVATRAMATQHFPKIVLPLCARKQLYVYPRPKNFLSINIGSKMGFSYTSVTNSRTLTYLAYGSDKFSSCK